ncbi:MAG TPA: serine/threonine-protein kinase [Polyangiaceae bacterium]|jgi:serine/threonine-protein kinase|nr:serine/threonine-protein kinase [Polyangiaceae bacterium]
MATSELSPALPPGASEGEAPRVDWASIRPRMSQTARSITLALPFGETPLDSDAGREFLQTRLALFSKVVFALGAFGFVAYQLVLTGLPNYDFWQLFWRSGTLFHLSATVLPVLVWLATRRRSLSLRALFALDAGGILFVLAAYGAMAVVGAQANPQRIDLVMMLITLCMLCLRAVVIPSTWLHTLVVGVLGSIPVFSISILNAPKLVIYGAHIPAVSAAGYIVMWIVVGLAISGLASQVIYGLHCQVAQAARLGQYVLEQKIGEGGMGAVYKARHALLRRPTAIKLVLPERAGPQILARFEREVQLTSSLTHPNTVSVYDYGHTPAGVFYYAMEYLDGIDLEQLVKRFGPQPPNRVVHILSQVAGSLGEAHGVGLVHRDVKPANVILCDRRGQPDTAKVVDFGLVKDLTAFGRPKLTLSATNTIVGTPLYLAPEAIVAPETVDARADIYALGAVGYYLLTGRPVFSGSSLLEVAAQHLHQSPVPPSQISEQPIPPELEALLLSCLSKDAEQRPQSAEEVAAQLAELPIPPWRAAHANAWWSIHGEHVRARNPGSTSDAPPATHTVVVDLAGREREA